MSIGVTRVVDIRVEVLAGDDPTGQVGVGRNSAIDHSDPDSIAGQRRRAIAPAGRRVHDLRIQARQRTWIEWSVGELHRGVINDPVDPGVAREEADLRRRKPGCNPVGDRNPDRLLDAGVSQVGIELGQACLGNQDHIDGGANAHRAAGFPVEPFVLPRRGERWSRRQGSKRQADPEAGRESCPEQGGHPVTGR